MLVNDPQVNSIQSNPSNPEGNSTHQTRYPLTRSPGRSRFFQLPSSNEGDNRTQNESNAVIPSREDRRGGSDSRAETRHQQQQHQQQQQSNILNQSNQSLQPHPNSRQSLGPQVQHSGQSHLCQVCIPLTSFGSPGSTHNTGQIGCYLCNSPTPGHTLNRTGTTGQLTSMPGPIGSSGGSLIPKSSNMPLDMNIYATRKTIAQGKYSQRTHLN